MLRFRGKIVYVNGDEAEFEAGSASIAAWERYAIRSGLPYGTDSPAAFSDLVVAHHALGVDTALDPWIETVLSVELKPEEELPPTEPTP